jgi:hypothetical protein
MTFETVCLVRCSTVTASQDDRVGLAEQRDDYCNSLSHHPACAAASSVRRLSSVCAPSHLVAAGVE